MNLYLIEQDLNENYDSYDSAVVVAVSEEHARRIHPSHFYRSNERGWLFQYADGREDLEDSTSCWIAFADIDRIKVTYLGIASTEQKPGVVLASFNAG